MSSISGDTTAGPLSPLPNQVVRNISTSSSRPPAGRRRPARGGAPTPPCSPAPAADLMPLQHLVDSIDLAI